MTYHGQSILDLLWEKPMTAAEITIAFGGNPTENDEIHRDVKSALHNLRTSGKIVNLEGWRLGMQSHYVPIGAREKTKTVDEVIDLIKEAYASGLVFSKTIVASEHDLDMPTVMEALAKMRKDGLIAKTRATGRSPPKVSEYRLTRRIR